VEIILFFAVFAVGIIIIVATNYTHFSSYSVLPTFAEYQAKHPGLVQRGRVECEACGGTKIFVRGLYSATDSKKTHGCTTCGKALYRSKS